MSTDGCLIVYYVTNLLVLSKFEESLKVIESYGFLLLNDKVCQANLKKMQAYAL